MPTDAKGRFFGILTDCCHKFRRGEEVDASPIRGTLGDWSYSCKKGHGCAQMTATDDFIVVGMWRYCHSDLCDFDDNSDTGYTSAHEITLSDLHPEARRVLEIAGACWGTAPTPRFQAELVEAARAFAASVRGCEPSAREDDGPPPEVRFRNTLASSADRGGGA